MRVCEMDLCERQHRAKGLCWRHYKRLKRTGRPEGLRKLHADQARRVCRVETCDGTHYAKGLCRLHWARQHKGQSITYAVHGTENRVKHPLYRRYKSLRRRCLSPTAPQYEYYGARGIKLCERWQGKDGFTNFVEDMGVPDDLTLSIDRIDNYGDYEPSNCRWATKAEQIRNRRPRSEWKNAKQPS